jgi:putative spermidine/putrescine transport system permease protein
VDRVNAATDARTASQATVRPVAHGRENGFMILLGAFAVFMVLPTVATILFSISEGWTDTILPTRYLPDYWINALTDPLFVPTITRSLLASLGTMVVSIVLMTPTLYVLHISARRLRPLAEVVSLAPFALPAVVFALALIRTYSVPPLVLTGTPTLLVISYTIVSLPFVYRAIDNSLSALDTKALYEAAQTLGAGRWAPFWGVILPSIRRGVVAAALLVLSVTFGEYTLSAFLVGDAWKTSGVWVYSLWDNHPHETMAVGIVSFAITWTASLILLVMLGRRAVFERVG